MDKGRQNERRKGNHFVMRHPHRKKTSIVAMLGKDMPPPTLKEMLKQAGFTPAEFLDLF